MSTEHHIEPVKERILHLRDFISRDERDELRAYIESELYAPDVAELFYELHVEEIMIVISVLNKDMVVDVLRNMDFQQREKLMSHYSAEQIAHDFVEYMDSDDAVDLLNQFSLEKRDDVIAHMTDLESSRNIVSLLHYREHTAGAMMAREFVKVNINWTMAQCTDEIRSQAENVENVYSVYVVDDNGKLQGTVSLKSIILSNARTKVEKVYSEDLISVNTHTPAEEVAQIMRKYDLVVIPVVDTLNRILGRITFDDVVDYIKEEADKDYQLVSGLTEDVEITDKVWILSRARLPWLLIGLLGGIASSRVIGMYEDDISLFPQMAFYMPLVAAMGGNAGVQSSAIIVQGLANNTLGTRNILPKLGKEFMVALLNSLICAMVIMAYNEIIGSSTELGYTVSIALVSAIIFASLLGMLIPMMLDRFRIDPALATGPFITTTNDLLGLGLYFMIGHVML